MIFMLFVHNIELFLVILLRERDYEILNYVIVTTQYWYHI